MTVTMRTFALLFTLVAACSAGDDASARRADSATAAAADTTTRRDSAGGTTVAPAPVAMDSSGAIRALYVNRWATQSRARMKKMIDIADSTEINALVLDMKDEFGLNYTSANPEYAKLAGSATKVPRLKELLDTLRAHGILSIARIVVFKDSVAARSNGEWTIRRPDGSIWRDKKGLAWVNPYHKALWEYNIGVAEELVKLGFGEIQWDYIRFPEPYASLPPQVFPGANNLSKPQALADFLALAKKRLNALGVRSTADIFGLVTTVRGPLEIGQHWEKVAPVTDVLLPMVYPSHYPRGSFGIPHPNSDPYKTIKIAIDTARVRNKKLGITTPEHVRPWIQAFTLGPPEYGPEQIKQQKQAIYDAGYDGWILWSPGSRYESFLPALEKTLESRKKKID
jgi:hypothetical protein